MVFGEDYTQSVVQLELSEWDVEDLSPRRCQARGENKKDDRSDSLHTSISLLEGHAGFKLKRVAFSAFAKSKADVRKR